MLNFKINYAALESYRNNTRRNKEETEIMLRLKLMKNWLSGNKTFENEYIEVRQYGNLQIIKGKDSNTITKVTNIPNPRKVKGLGKYQEIKDRAEIWKAVLGIDYIRKNGYEICGYEINSRAYKNFIAEKGFITYKELLDECIYIIQNGDKVREFNDKRYIKFHDWVVTLTDNKYITNIRIEGDN